MCYEGIYSQAYALYKQGFQYWFSQQEIEELTLCNRQFETPRLEAELVSLYFRKPYTGEPGEFMSVARALQIVGTGITQKLSAVYMGRAFGDMGYQRVKSNGVRGYIVVRRSVEEMNVILHTMASEAQPEGQWTVGQ